MPPPTPGTGDALVRVRARDALTVRGWFETAGGVHYWRGAHPDEWWLTPKGAPDCPSPWALPHPETLTDWGRFVVVIPRLLSQHPVQIARAIPLGIYLTAHAQRKVHAETRRLRAQHTHEVWVEFDVPHDGSAVGTARWYVASMLLPLADVKEDMEFLR